MTRSRNHVVALLATAAGLLTASPAFAGSWQNSFSGFNATLKGDLYTPTTPAAKPAILVVIHMCSGHSSTVHGWFDSYADANGFYLIAPDAGKNCFDASAARTGDKAAVVTMVNYLITNKGADASRVFAAGMSSGGCMTNTLIAVYPDVFAGGSAMPGFPAGTWPAGDTSCTKCSSSPPSMTGAQWAALATNVFKWSGQYGCSQQWVGGGDQYNFNGYLPAVVLQWTTLANLGAATSEASWSDHSGWTRTVYKDSAGNVRLETNLGPTSQKHDLETVSPTLYKDVITFLGLDKPTGACGLTTSTTGSAGTSGGTGTGGAAGAKGTGGATGTGGAAGAKGTGGVTATGGVTGTGGVTSTGGVTGTGGVTSTGGVIGTGGVKGTGGVTSTGGVTGTGGAETGGANGEGGATGTGGTETGGTTGEAGSAGCSCSVDTGLGHRGPLVILLGIAFAFAARRRRSRR
jgi:poly(3-hydroxybutyrate) depolymerase